MTRCAIAVLVLSLCVPTLRAQEAKESTERTEDIEVLRRILNKSLGITPQAAQPGVSAAPNQLMNPALLPYTADPAQLMPFFNPQVQPTFNYPRSLTNLNRAETNPIAPPAIAPFDGIYLKGHGVVFTLKIPTGAPSPLVIGKAFGLSETCVKCHSLDAVPKAAVEAELDVKEGNKPYTEWLRTQDELRGKKPTDAPPQATDVPVCEPGKLAARLTEKLFHNQHHVRHVPGTESFTVVVTYEGYTGSARHQAVATAFDTGTADPTRQQSGGVHVEEAQQIRFADLHMKNHKLKEAEDAYTQALKRFTSPDVTVVLGSAGASMTAEQKITFEQKTQTLLRTAFRNLAETCMALKHDDRAAKALEMSQKLTVTVQSGAAPAPSGIAVPAKLVLSFKRADVTNSLVDFKKIVKVETIGFPPADPKPAKK